MLKNFYETYPRFQVHQDRSRNIVLIISLIKEYILPISSFGSPFFKYSILADPMFSAETLPKHGAHFQFSKREWIYNKTRKVPKMISEVMIQVKTASDCVRTLVAALA
jgi:hypothetical protein